MGYFDDELLWSVLLIYPDYINSVILNIQIISFIVLCFIQGDSYAFLSCSGHMIQEVPEFPLVVSDKIQEYNKTKQAVIFLRRMKAWNDIQKVNGHLNVIKLFVHHRMSASFL